MVTAPTLGADARTAVLLAGVASCTTLACTSPKLPLGPASGYALALLINLAAVSIPGRFDGDPKILAAPPWPTLLNPAGWAFAIWAPIYLGELAGAALVASRGEASAAVSSSNPAWLAANIAQALWCAAYRPWALDKLWLPTTILATTAGCLALAQLRLVHAIPSDAPRLIRWSLMLPRSLHLGWVCAASLVNLSAWVGYQRFGPIAALATASASVGAAALLGCLFATAGLPTATLALAWALLALSSGKPVGADAIALGGAGSRALGRLAIAESATAFALVGAVIAVQMSPSLAHRAK